MSAKPQTDALARLAEHLSRQREAILDDWRSTAEAEGTHSTLAELSRTDFYDHLPQFLDQLFARFRGDDVESIEATAEQHGAHRWQLGQHVDQLVLDWALLHRVLLRRIGASKQAAGLDAASFEQAYALLSELIHKAISDSLREFHDRLRVQADARVRDIEAVLEERNEVDQLRGQSLREASHDLRGSLQTIRLSCQLLERQSLGPRPKAVVKRIGVAAESLNRMLTDLLDLARLEAGRETREIGDFDAAAILRELCDGMQAEADSKALALRAIGPRMLRVRGDATRVRRIAQNLILNALKYTSKGGVEVEWGRESAERWQFEVRDTGPGLKLSSSSNYAGSIENAESESEGEASTTGGGSTRPQPAATAASVAAHGEGIGLAIVHRLCDLLDAVLEVESGPGRGTTFRVLFPTSYRASPSKARSSESSPVPHTRATD
ncbi:MAG TPA: sensor histidine kinase [Gammaproteobacteria bacterium]|nr:sensor histidine kinase [Gammaproteobacteria bacterium]